MVFAVDLISISARLSSLRLYVNVYVYIVSTECTILRQNHLIWFTIFFFTNS